MIIKIKGRIPRKKKKAFKRQFESIPKKGLVVHYGDRVEVRIDSVGGDLL